MVENELDEKQQSNYFFLKEELYSYFNSPVFVAKSIKEVTYRHGGLYNIIEVSIKRDGKFFKIKKTINGVEKIPAIYISKKNSKDIVVGSEFTLVLTHHVQHLVFEAKLVPNQKE